MTNSNELADHQQKTQNTVAVIPALTRSSAFNLNTMCSSSSQGTVDDDQPANLDAAEQCQSLDLEEKSCVVPEKLCVT